jgi:hypothetical protein
METRTDRARRLTGLVAGAALAAGALVLGPSAASAAGGPATRGVAACTAAGVPAAQAALETALGDRVTRLQALSGAVAGATRLVATDRTTLTTDLDNERSGIQGLVGKAPTDTTCAAVVADAKAMVVDYRVFLVMSPQVHLVVAADTEASITSQLQALEASIAARIAAAQAKGTSVSAPQATFSDFEAKLSAAAQSSSGVSASVLSFTPASYPGCVATFQSDKAALEAGRTALEQAHADLRTLKDDAR